MRARRRTWRLREAVAVVTMSFATPLAAQSPPDQARLARFVRQECGSCHGLTLRGGLGKALTAEALAGLDREELARIIQDGVPGTPMPPWRAVLGERDVRWIADALKKGTLP